MNFSALQLTVVLLVPVLLTAIVWRYCQTKPALAKVTGGFLSGAIVVWPVVQLSNFITGRAADATGRYYLDELLEMMLATALPEEVGKGLMTLLAVRLNGAPTSPLAWLACGAAAH